MDFVLLGALLQWLLVYTPEASSWEIQPQSAPVFEDAWTALVGILPVLGMALVACWLSLAVGFRWRNLDELTGTPLQQSRPFQLNATKPTAWSVIDLFLLIAGCAVLLQVSGPYAATARDELQMLYDNEVFSQFLRPISMTALLTTALARVLRLGEESLDILAWWPGCSGVGSGFVRRAARGVHC